MLDDVLIGEPCDPTWPPVSSVDVDMLSESAEEEARASYADLEILARFADDEGHFRRS